MAGKSKGAGGGKGGTSSPAPAANPPSTPPTPPTPPSRAWKDNWQAPALVIAGVLLVAGVVTLLVSKPRPDLSVPIHEAEALIAREHYTEALALLNKEVRPYVDRPALSGELLQRFYVLRGRALYLGQKLAKVDVEENHRAIVGEYLGAERAGATLEARDTGYLGDTYISLDQFDQALQRADRLGPTERSLKGTMLRRMVEKKLSARNLDVDGTLTLLDEFLRDEQLSATERAWALARQTDMLLRQGYNENAVTRLLRSMPGLTGADPEALGELFMLLGRAYLESGALGEAPRQLEQADRLLANSPVRAQVLLLLARVDEINGDIGGARQKYATILELYGGSPSEAHALLGLGESDAALGATAASVESYQRLVRALPEAPGPGVTREMVAASLMRRYEDRSAAGDIDGAAQYAALAMELFGPESAPAEVVLAGAQSSRRLAERLLSQVGEERLLDLAGLDPSTREEARRCLVTAGHMFKRHADAVVELDNRAYAESLWMAADSLDRAGSRDEAVALYTAYAEGFPGDPRQAEARFRLGQAWQARGDYESAAKYYRELIDGAVSEAAGPLADASYVPLAQVYLVDADEGNDAEAERLLDAVVSGQIGGAQTGNYRDALVELAGLKSRAGDHTTAIERLEEALARFPDDKDISAIVYALGEAHRLEAGSIGTALEEAMPDHQKQRLRAARKERLTRAAELYERARLTLDAKDERRLTDLERVRLRNSCFFKADCAFDLGDYEAAIREYDAAKERYPKDPSSLVAMIQIVNAYVAQGDLKRAGAANERARRFFESLPRTAWDDPDLPIGRDDWQRWLDSIATLISDGKTETAVVGESGQ